MKQKNESLTEIMLRFNMDKVAAKLLNEVERSTPQEIGRRILFNNRQRQVMKLVRNGPVCRGLAGKGAA